MADEEPHALLSAVWDQEICKQNPIPWQELGNRNHLPGGDQHFGALDLGKSGHGIFWGILLGVWDTGKKQRVWGFRVLVTGAGDKSPKPQCVMDSQVPRVPTMGALRIAPLVVFFSKNKNNSGGHKILV